MSILVLDREYEEYQDLKERVDKAIEYIEQHKNIMGFYEEFDGNDLIEILKGSESYGRF